MQRPEHRQWMAQWRAAAGALEEQHHAELRAMTAEQALAAADALLALASPSTLRPERRLGSGLVDLQRLLHRHATR